MIKAMKRLFTVLFASLLAVQVWAYNFQSGNLCYNITSSNNPYAVEVTYEGAWPPSNYSGLTTATIPEKVTYNGIEYSVTSIGDYAFNHCSSLTSVTIPNSVTNIGEAAFAFTGLTSITIPNSVTCIGSSAFQNCSTLSTVTIPNSVTNIGDYAFAHTGLTSVTIPNSVVSIDRGTFSECGDLKTVTIPESVASIGDYAFSGCSSLTSVTIPNSVTSMGYGAFNDCSSLTYNGYDNAYYLGNSENPYLCLIKAKSEYITSCEINGKCKFICNNAFEVNAFLYGYSSLTSVTIPNSVTTIGAAAFNDCRNLTSICYEGNSEPTYLPYAFTNVNETIPVCVPADYASTSWCGFSNLIKGHNKVTDAAVLATCTESGKTEGSHCSVCGKVFVAQEVIPAFGHEFVNYVYNNDATTEANGTETAVCERGCGATDTRVKEGTKLATSVSESAANTINIYAIGNTIVVENATEEIRVYNAMGALVGRDVARNACTIKINNPGVYIVKTGGAVKRVVVD